MSHLQLRMRGFFGPKPLQQRSDVALIKPYYTANIDARNNKVAPIIRHS